MGAGTVEAEAEGVALWSCTPDIGYWVAADQRYPQTHFLLFERESLAPRGSFMGEVTAHTDGIALHAAATTAFPYGALFAVHDDEAVAAFALGDVVRALALDPPCAPWPQRACTNDCRGCKHDLRTSGLRARRPLL